MFDEIDFYVSQCIALSTSELAFFHDLLTWKKFKKKEFILREGTVCHFEAFIIKGCVKSYFTSEDGDETIINFATENWWIGDLASFTSQKVSYLNFEALEDTEVFVIERQQKELLFQKIPAFERMFRLLVQRALVELQQRYFYATSKTAKERYLWFIEKYPTLIIRLPQYQIARYLGITPEFLSKIRAELVLDSKR